MRAGLCVQATMSPTKEARSTQSQRRFTDTVSRDLILPLVFVQGRIQMYGTPTIGNFASRRWRWLMGLVMLCLVLAPVLSAAEMAAAAVVQGRDVGVTHHDAGGSVSHSTEASQITAKVAKSTDGNADMACGEGCCLGNTCPLCGLGLGGESSTLSWLSPGRITALPFRIVIGIVPPPPSEPPRA